MARFLKSLICIAFLSACSSRDMTEPPSDCTNGDRLPSDVTNTTGIGPRDTSVIDTARVVATVGTCLPANPQVPIDRPRVGDSTLTVP